MLKFFKRTPEVPAKIGSSAQSRQNEPSSGRANKPVAPDPAPLPLVSEGNAESDWALWEDSVAFQDSQIPSSFGPLESVRERGQTAGDDNVDPFAAVRRRGQ